MAINGPNVERGVPSDPLRSGLAGRKVLIVEDDVALPAELLVPGPAEEMQAWRASDGAKGSRIEPHPRMAEAAAG